MIYVDDMVCPNLDSLVLQDGRGWDARYYTYSPPGSNVPI